MDDATQLPPALFAGGGEMGERIRAFDWSTSPLGPPHQWSPVLQASLGLVLCSHHPMVIFWGADSRCFYNDAYARSLDPAKHAVMLGAKAADVWHDRWHSMGPQVDHVMSGGGATWHEHQRLPIRRNVREECAYWTFAYSPIPDPGAPRGIGGVLVVCTETTQQMLTEQRQSFLVELGDALRQHNEPHRIIATAIDSIGRYLRVSRVGYGRVCADDEQIELATNYTDGAVALIGTFPLADFGREDIARQRRGETVVHDDLATDLEADAARWEARGTRAMVSVPLLREGRFCASLFVHHREPRVWSRSDVALIERVATRIWEALQRAQAEAELKLTSRLSEQHILDRERRMATLANAMPQLVWIGRPDGTLEYVNHRLCDYTGHSEAEAKRFELWSQLIHPEDVEQSLAIWSQAVPAGEPYTIEQRLRRRDGVYRWFLVRAEPERDAAGQVVRWYGTCTDIDEAKRLERHLVTQESLLREADQRKDRFLATLSHELRNPLAPICHAAQTLGLPDLPPQRLHWAQAVIKRQVTHMAWLLDDLLDVARITQGKLELKKSLVSLQTIVDAAVETTLPQFEEKQHQLSLHLPPDVPLLEADPVRLSQVLANLLNNAAKYTDSGGRIELSAGVEGGMVRISVKDNGIGIPPQSHDQIFEMFSQIDGRSTRAEGGLGIGLSLVKGLVALHGGTAEVASAGAAQGSEFTIRLPLPAMRDTRGTDAVAPELPLCAMRRRVLVADDNADAADSLAMLLELEGHEVRVAHGGRAALEIAAVFQPEVALLDIGMPDLTGYQVAEALRRESWGRAIELVALTGWGQDGDRRRSKAAGFDRHLTKPIDVDELTGVLSQSR